MDKKKRNAIRGLHLLSIGEILICIGLLVDLSFLTEWLYFAALGALVGIIIMLIGVIKLRKINRYFLISFFAVLATLIVGIVSSVLVGVFTGEEHSNILNGVSVAQDIFSKVISFVYTFGILRGCALAATQKTKSKFGKHMILVNGVGKFVALVLNLTVKIFLVSTENPGKTLSIIATVISIAVELYFCVFLFRTYRKAKAYLKSQI